MDRATAQMPERQGDDPLISHPSFIAPIRRVGLVALLLLLLSSLSAGGDPLGIGGLAVLVVSLGALDIRERRRGPAAPVDWGAVVAAILGIMTAVVLLTGGLDSALLILFVPVGFILGIATPGLRVALAPAGIVALIALGTHIAMPAANTWSWDWTRRGSPSTHNALLPLLVAMFSLACFRLGREARIGIARAREETERAHRARLDAVAERHAELLGLVGAVAHELKNPLTTVQSLTSHLHRKAEPDSRPCAQLAVVRGEVARIRATVDSLLNTARPLSPHMTMPDALHVVAADVVTSHRTLAEGREITLHPPSGAARAVFDRRKLVQVVGNLVLNAIEACAPGGHIRITVGADPDGAWLEVHDDGPGIAPELRDLIGRPGITGKPGGSGIGLALSRGIVEQHRGQLTVLDAPSGGCRARVWLPSGDARPAEGEP